MKKLLLTTAMLAAAGFAHAQYAASDLVGTWNCDLEQQNEQMTMVLTYEVTYNDDRTSEATMVMAMEAPALEESMRLGMSVTGDWSIEGDQLVNTTTSMEMQNLGESSQFADMVVQQFESQEQVGTVSRNTILELTGSSLVVQQDQSPDPVTCRR